MSTNVLEHQQFKRGLRFTVALLALAFAPTPASDQAATSPATEACPAPDTLTNGLSHALATVRYLADDALQGRMAGSPGERCAGDYIAERFRRLGLEPAGPDDSYFQPVTLESAVNPHAPRGEGRNVIGRLVGADPALADEAVVVGAHYDHLGMGGFGSVNPEDHGQIHNGADDNASGVAALLQVARRLTEGPRPARSVVFVAFTGEEFGLLGSSLYVEQPAISIERTRAMLNLDMVGRLETDELIVYGVGTADEWNDLVSRAADSLGIPVAFREEGYGPSDHTSFYVADVPVLHFFTNVHGDYHRPSDDWEKIDETGIERVAGLVTRLTREVASRPTALTVRTGVGTPPHAGPAGEVSGYGAYLGTVPDFTPVERGVLLSGVSDGSPAERAGLRKGDIIVGFADMEIPDLQALADALRAHSPGDTVEVRVLRDDTEIPLTAVLGERGAR